jgi:hypothetical protein
MRERRSIGIYVLIFSLYLLIGACTTTSGAKANESFIQASYKTLVTAADVYETSMETAGALYKKGILQEAQKEQIIKVAQKYHDAWHAARKALEEYKKAPTPANKTALQTAMDIYINNQADLLKTLKNTLGGI